MNIERDDSPSTTDESVTRAYRDIAEERVPEHLDRAVLDRAARAARPRYARSRAWTRPLAWAATIALSVAIVLELSQGPALEESVLPETPAWPDGADQSVPSESPPPTGSAAVPEGRSNDLIPEAREKPSRAQKTSTPIVVESMAVEDKREADEPTATPVPQRALAPAPAAVTFGAESAVSDPDQCSPADTEQPSSWLECIERLERAGLVDEAAEERQRLRDTFPGFELP